jgi:beta-galactosidase
MREAGLSLVRIGEFAWQKIESQEEQFTWDWLDRAIQTLASEGLQVVLGTPTAAPPAWLVRAYPQILPVNREGHRKSFGARRHYCPTSGIYRRHVTRLVSALAQRYGAHPALAGWQVDNELGGEDTARCFCERCTDAFRLWLSEKYGSLEALNQAWGTSFWSQTYSAWEEIELPDSKLSAPNPGQALDYFRFASHQMGDFLNLQVDLLHRHAPGKPVTTNFMGNFSDLDYQRLSQPLDFVSWDSYPTGSAEMQAAELYFPQDSRPSLAYDAGDPYITDFCHATFRGLKQAPFWVMEQQAGNINWSLTNTAVRPETVRLWTWHNLASGAEAALYFRWRAVHFGQEQYHSGLLKHDAAPDSGYTCLLYMRGERSLMDAVSAEPLAAQTAILLDYEDLWAIGMQPHHKDFRYLRHLFVYYQALVRLGLQVDIVSPQADLRSYRLVIAPTAHIVSETLNDSLARYVRRGGTLLLGVRSGVKTEENQVTDLPLPGQLRYLTGATISAWHALADGAAYDLESEIPGLQGPATVWAEAIHPPFFARNQTTSGETQIYRSLARYTEGPFAGETALGEHAFGSGRVFSLGWYPNGQQARALLLHLAQELDLPALPGLPPGVITVRRGPYLLLLNFNEHPEQVQVEDQLVEIPGRDIRVLSSLPISE